MEAIVPAKVSLHDEPLAYVKCVHYFFSSVTAEYVKIVLKMR
jgi:hypothetical protein